MDVMEAARKAEAGGRRIIHMEVGQPGTGAPAAAIEALRGVMGGDPLGYTVALGLPELRARIARLYGEWYGVDLDPGRVVVTPGSSGAFLLAFTALFDNGDRVGIGAPGYPSYRQILKAVGLEPVVIEAAEANGYQLVPEDLTGQDLAGLMVASPANPTGTMLGRDGAGRSDRGGAGFGNGVHFRRDIPRNRIRQEGGECAGDCLTTSMSSTRSPSISP
jgi:aspartate/methionine/tyrosine aminotransferase